MLISTIKASFRPRLLGLVAVGGASIALMAAGAPQCARTGDEVLAPTLSATGQGVAPCQRGCAETAGEARRAEVDRFVEAIHNCDPGTDCRAREAALHVSIMQSITENERICMSGCHNQGRGHGGN
jgi:hypothetical protein